eukprot:753410-Rhodomonas_salina.1
MKQGTSGTTPKTPGTPRDGECAPENSGDLWNQAGEMSVPTHQPHGNSPSGKYVPPAGTTGPR